MTQVWRLIDSGHCSASWNMALDEALALSVRAAAAPPTLRLYCWTAPSISLGAFQKASDIDLDFCREQRIPVVRRPTGGRAILHGDELTYSVSAGTDTPPFDRGLMESYRALNGALRRALRASGIEADMKLQKERGSVLAGSPHCFGASSYGELRMGSRKIAGSAQRRWPEGLLQQGSLPYRLDWHLMSSIFGRAGAEERAEKMSALADIRPDIDRDGFKKAVVKAFEESFGITLQPSCPEPSELQSARDLEQGKYLQGSWNFRLQAPPERPLPA